MGWNAGSKSNGLDFSDDCTECAQIAAANAVAAASMHSRCKVPPNCVSIQYRRGTTLLFYKIEPKKNETSLILPSSIHSNIKQKDFLKSCEGFLRWSNLSSQISTWTELDGAWYIFWIESNIAERCVFPVSFPANWQNAPHCNGTFIAPQMKSFGPKKI